ncbi:hypothetical protein MJT46_018747 [Ovis ammon polii x Ovis aries]|nr:hypothetical protein MJT46_018747 [Ovis ammon polii x Ovis aries]
MAQAAKQLKKIKDIEAQALQEQKEKEESNRKRRNRSRDRKKKTEARLFLMTSEAVDTLPTPGVLPHAPHGAAWVYGATLPPAPSVPTITPSKKLSQVWARDTREEVPGLKGESAQTWPPGNPADPPAAPRVLPALLGAGCPQNATSLSASTVWTWLCERSAGTAAGTQRSCAVVIATGDRSPFCCFSHLRQLLLQLHPYIICGIHRQRYVNCQRLKAIRRLTRCCGDRRLLQSCTIIGNKLFDVVFTPFPRNRTPSKQGASDQIGSVKTDPGDCLKTGSL